MKLGAVALDGTKVAADAALDLNRSHEAIEEEVQRMLREAKATDTEAAAKASQEHLVQRQAEEEATGKKKRGRKPKVVEPGPRNSDGNPDSPQAVVFLMSIIDVRVGC